MSNDRLLTQAEKDAMQVLSISILDLCDQSGLKDGELIANAAIIGCAGAVASTIPDNCPILVLEAMADRAGAALAKEIKAGVLQFRQDLQAHAKSN